MHTYYVPGSAEDKIPFRGDLTGAHWVSDLPYLTDVEYESQSLCESHSESVARPRSLPWSLMPTSVSLSLSSPVELGQGHN